MSDVVHLTVAAVKAIHARVLDAHGGRAGIRDEGLLQSAIAAPQATAGGVALLSDPTEIGAAYLYHLCRNHPFIDGNKRTGLASCLVFLHHNGHLDDLAFPSRDVDAWESLVLDVAASRLGRDDTTARLRALLPSGRR